MKITQIRTEVWEDVITLIWLLNSNSLVTSQGEGNLMVSSGTTSVAGENAMHCQGGNSVQTPFLLMTGNVNGVTNVRKFLLMEVEEVHAITAHIPKNAGR